MATEDPYVQFPILALRTHQDFRHRYILQFIRSESAYNTGLAMLRQFRQQEREHMAFAAAEQEMISQNLDWDLDDDDVIATLLGGNQHQVHQWQDNDQHIAGAIAIPAALCNTRRQWPTPYHPSYPGKIGGSRQARIRLDIHLDYENTVDEYGNFASYATLAAINAGIGRHPFARLSHNQIRSMAMGYSGIKEHDELTDHDKRPSLKSTQSTVLALAKHKLITRAKPNRRHVYYSNRLSQQQLEVQVQKAVIDRTLRKNTRQQHDVAYRDNVKRQQQKALLEHNLRIQAAANRAQVQRDLEAIRKQERR